jgi:hypothetical protein
MLEARVGIEPTHKGFADLSLTTWVPRPSSYFITLSFRAEKVYRVWDRAYRPKIPSVTSVIWPFERVPITIKKMALKQHPGRERATNDSLQLDSLQTDVLAPVLSQDMYAIFEEIDSGFRSSIVEGSSIRPFAILLTLGSFLLQLCGLLRHAMWRDEMQVWLLARYSHSFRELLYYKRYECHPAAWYSLVYLASRVSSNPFAMQLVHLLIASSTIYVLARYSPFTRVQKVLLVCGYFLVFEYATISRCYALGVLLVFCFCAVFQPGSRKRYFTLSLLLALLAETSAYGAIIAAVLALFLALEFVSAPGPLLWKNFRQIVAPAFVFAGGMALAAMQMVVPKDSRFAAFLHFSLDESDIELTLSAIWKAFVPLPELTIHFWNSNIVHGPLLPWLSITVLGISVLFLVRHWTLTATYGCGVAVLLVFRHILKWGVSLRHDGHFFILFLVCVWLAAKCPEKPLLKLQVDRIFGWFLRKRDVILTGLLAVHAVAGIGVTAVALVRPFSQSEATAQFLKTNHLDRMFIVGETDHRASSVVGYLNRPIYYYDEGRMGSFVVWAQPHPPKESVLEVAAAKAVEQRQDVLAILNRRPPSIPVNIRELASFEGSIVEDEIYYVYLIPYQDAVRQR